MFSYVASQTGDTTDVVDLAQFCVYVHYMYNKEEDEFLFGKILSNLKYSRKWINSSTHMA